MYNDTLFVEMVLSHSSVARVQLVSVVCVKCEIHLYARVYFRRALELKLLEVCEKGLCTACLLAINLIGSGAGCEPQISALTTACYLPLAEKVHLSVSNSRFYSPQ